MKDIQPLTLLKKKYTYNILDAFEIEINVTGNPYNLPIEELFTMAARINKKRSFLFVSKVLGKHLPINPKKGLLTGALLAASFAESIKNKYVKERDAILYSFFNREPDEIQPFIPNNINPVIIGFAETATALGHSFFDSFQNADFFHTTREEIQKETPVIMFEEEHSHATSHRCYIPLEIIQNDREIILVDDEMTTGKTALNIIESIQHQFPRFDYTVVSILDWRSTENKQRFRRLEEKLGIRINVVSLLSGDVQITEKKELNNRNYESMKEVTPSSNIEMIDLTPFYTPISFLSSNQKDEAPYIRETGRFGMGSEENVVLHKVCLDACEFLKKKRTGNRTLCLGTGEFMYLPMKLSAGMGEGISYHSTTRSPIYIENQTGYGARYGLSFPSPENPSIIQHVYNIPPGYYDELFLFFEREVKIEDLRPLLKQLESLQLPSIKVVFASVNRGEQYV